MRHRRLSLGGLARRREGRGQGDPAAGVAGRRGQASAQAPPFGRGVHGPARDHERKVPHSQSHPSQPGSLDEFLADVVDILRGEVAELVRLGATYIQIDAPQYTAALDPKGRAFYESRGWRGEEWLSRGIEMDNAVMDGFPDVTFGFHL